MTKRKKLAAILALVVVFLFLFPRLSVRAEGEKASATEKIGETAEELLDQLDLRFLNDYEELAKRFFGEDGTLKDNLLSAMKGETATDYDDLFSYLKELLFSSLKSKLPLIVSLFCLIVFCSLARAFAPGKSDNGTGEIVHFVTFAVVISAVSVVVAEALSETKETIDRMSGVIDGVFPVLLSIMAATGQSSSVSAFGPAASFFSVCSASVIGNVVYPVVSFLFAIAAVSNVGKGIRLNSLFSFFQSLLKWLIGLFGATFSVYLTVRGIAASSFDGIALRTLKYAVGNSVPYVGGILKEGTDVILLSATLVKNALGVFGILVVFSAAIVPVTNMVALRFLLKLLAGVTEPLSGGRVGDFFEKTAVVLDFLVAAILLTGFLFLSVVVMILLAGGTVI